MLMDMPEPYAEWQRGVTDQKESSHYLFAVGCGGTLVRPAAIARNFEVVSSLISYATGLMMFG